MYRDESAWVHGWAWELDEETERDTHREREPKIHFSFMMERLSHKNSSQQRTYCIHFALGETQLFISFKLGAIFTRSDEIKRVDIPRIQIGPVYVCASWCFHLIPLFSWPQAWLLAAVVGAHNVLNVRNNNNKRHGQLVTTTYTIFHRWTNQLSRLFYRQSILEVYHRTHHRKRFWHQCSSTENKKGRLRRNLAYKPASVPTFVNG